MEIKEFEKVVKEVQKLVGRGIRMSIHVEGELIKAYKIEWEPNESLHTLQGTIAEQIRK